jgi:hypothetical protein
MEFVEQQTAQVHITKFNRNLTSSWRAETYEQTRTVAAIW